MSGEWRDLLPTRKPDPRATPDKELRRTVALVDKFGGDRNRAATELNLSPPSVRHRLRNAKTRLGIEPKVAHRHDKCGPRIPNDVVEQRMRALVESGGNVSDAAKALGVPRGTLASTIRDHGHKWKPGGQNAPRKPTAYPLPRGKDIKRYIVTCAQSGTKLHEKTWAALHALADHYDAEVLVSTFSYAHRQEGSAKRGTQTNNDSEWYDPRIELYVCDEMVALAPSLVFNGHMNILPTATDPLSGLDSYNGRASSIFPHAKVAMRSVATMTDSAAKLQYTTGAATQLNYIQRKAGQKAEFDHVFGGLVVEVNADGAWWVRQLSIDRAGRMFDLDVVAMPEVDSEGYHVIPHLGVKALVFGDLHAVHLDGETMEQRWGKSGIVAALKPDIQVAHDILDFESRGHHNRRDPHKMFELHARGRECVETEVRGVGKLLATMAAHSKVVVASSNHDRHLDRWLKEADWRSDPVNAEFYNEAQRAYLKAIRSGRPFDALRWAVAAYEPVRGVRFLTPGESHVICRDGSGGIELGLHGDQGPGGSRGSIRNLARLGRKVVIGHSHSAGIYNGAYQVGVTAPFGAFDYAKGAPSAWTHTDCIVHGNGKRQLVTWWKGRYRA